MPREILQAGQHATRCSTPSPSCIRYLKDNFFLQTKEEDSDPYESQPVHACVIANASGIFGVYSYREVFEFERFWGIGSGPQLCARRDVCRLRQGQDRASEIAEIGVRGRLRIRQATRPAPVRRVHTHQD